MAPTTCLQCSTKKILATLCLLDSKSLPGNRRGIVVSTTEHLGNIGTTTAPNVTAMSCGGPIDFVPCANGIPPDARGDQAPLLERFVGCMSGTVSLNEVESGKIGE